MLLGFKKGQIPSITNSRANATSRSCHIRRTPKKNRGHPGPVFDASTGRRTFSQSGLRLSIIGAIPKCKLLFQAVLGDTQTRL
jgi:hypothetical protein